MLSRYAEKTSVSAEQSRAEVERTLQRYGADSFISGWEGNIAAVVFQMKGRRIKFAIRMPGRDDKEFSKTPTGRARKGNQAFEAWQQEIRRRWRSLALAIKAKLEAVESGIASFEEEFLPYTVLPNGQTVGEFMLPQVDQAYKSGEMPPLLPAPSRGKRGVK